MKLYNDGTEDSLVMFEWRLGRGRVRFATKPETKSYFDLAIGMEKSNVFQVPDLDTLEVDPIGDGDGTWIKVPVTHTLVVAGLHVAVIEGRDPDAEVLKDALGHHPVPRPPGL